MFRVYYTDPVTGWPHAHNVDTLNQALEYTEGFRKVGMAFVTMVCEDPNQIGKPGVDSIKDGILPDGLEYVYKGRRNA